MYASSAQKSTAPVGKQTTAVPPFQRQATPQTKNEEPEFQDHADASPETKQLKSVQQIADQSPQSTALLQFQRMANRHRTGQTGQGFGQKNKHGLPHALQSGIEQLSGQSMADVRVHYNSPKPAQLQAYAYAQGRDIHLSRGQEKHLPHEAWHVVQQKQGRVQPTLQMKGKVNINDDVTLEREADVMGARALTTGLERAAHQGVGQLRATALSGNYVSGQPIQRALRKGTSRKTYSTKRKVAKNIIEGALGHPVSKSILNAINRIHLTDPYDCTIKKAYQRALAVEKASPKTVTGRTGVGPRLDTPSDLLSWAEGEDFDTSELDTYMASHSKIFDVAWANMEIHQGDFPLSSAQSASQVKAAVTDSMMSLPSHLIRTISTFNDLADSEIKVESGIGSAWKGNQFEQWVDVNLFPSYKHRLFFRHKDLTKDRSTDGFDLGKNEIWEYKHYSGTVPVDQYEDYATILTKKIKDSSKKYTPKKVNYLFQDKATATVNLWITTTANFHVWYVQSGMPPKAVKLG